MTNHGYVTLTKEISTSDLYNATNEIIANKFGNKIWVESIIEEWSGKKSETLCVMIKTKDGQEENVHSFWLTDENGAPIELLAKSKHIEFRHTIDPFSWIEMIITNQLAYKFDGIITDDGHDSKQKPNIEKYQTYREYRVHMYARKQMLSFFEKIHLNKHIKMMVNYFGDIFADTEV